MNGDSQVEFWQNSEKKTHHSQIMIFLPQIYFWGRKITTKNEVEQCNKPSNYVTFSMKIMNEMFWSIVGKKWKYMLFKTKKKLNFPNSALVRRIKVLVF